LPTVPTEFTKYAVSRAEIALKSKQIKNSSEDEVKEILKKIYSMVGLRAINYPQGEDKKNLHDYIFFKYGQKTLDELVLAFDLAISGELEIAAGDVKVYDQFTINYLATIMAGYKKWLFNQAKNFELNKPLQIENKKTMDDNEWDEWLEEIKGYRLELIPIAAYERLTATGKLNLTTEQKKAYYASAKNYYLATFKDDVREMKRFADNLSNNCLTQEQRDGLVAFSKKLAVQDYLTKK